METAPDLFTATIVPMSASGGLRLVDQTTEAEPIAWLVGNVVARGAVTMLAGAAGAGKSLLCLQWALAAAATQRVAVVDAENGEQVIKLRLEAATGPRPAVYEARGFDLESGLAHLDTILRGGVDLLILDSWVSLWTGSENSIPAVKRSLEGLRTLAQRYNAGILLIHHATKESDTYRGSGAIASTIEAVFTFSRVEGTPDRLLTCRKMRIAPEPDEERMALVDGQFRAVTDTPAAVRSGRPGRAPTPRELDRLLATGVLNKREARHVLVAQGHVPKRAWWRFGR